MPRDTAQTARMALAGHAAEQSSAPVLAPRLARRLTPAEYARETFDSLRAIGSDYASAMREARIALADARADDIEDALRARGMDAWRAPAAVQVILAAARAAC